MTTTTGLGATGADRHRGRRADIQGLRALAVVLVVAYHADLALPGGFIGVDVFFVISGFVITRMLLAELSGSGRLDLRRFYLRRVRRILPALALLLFVVLIAGVLLAPQGAQGVTARTGAAAALFSANLYLLRSGGGEGYFDVEAETNPLLHTWSLSVEEQFYFIFPALLLAAWTVAVRIGRTPQRAVAAVLGLVVAGSFALSFMLTSGPGPFRRFDAIADLHREVAFYTPVTRAWEFAAGGLLAFVAFRVRGPARAAGTVLAVGSCALVAAAAVLFDGRTAFPGGAALLPVIGACGLIVAGEVAPSNPVSWLLSTGPAQWLGDVSYSWYLWHWPAIVFAAALWPGDGGASTPTIKVAAAVLSVVPAWASYSLFENPIRHRPRVRAAATLRLAAVCICVPLLAAGLHLAGQRAMAGHSAVVAFDEAMRGHADVLRGCDSDRPLADRDDDCTWRVADPEGTAVLIGDSNAGHFTEGFVAGANAAGYDAIVATNSACPFVDLLMVREQGHDEGCRTFVEGTVADLQEMEEVAYVVLASASDRYIELDEFWIEDPVDGARFESADEKAAVWVEGLQRSLTAVNGPARDVVIINPVPKFGEWDPRTHAAYRWVSAPEDLGLSVDRATADGFRARAVEAEQAAATAVGDVRVMDVVDELSAPDSCTIHRDGQWLWRDGSHISVDAALLLAEDFAEILR